MLKRILKVLALSLLIFFISLIISSCDSKNRPDTENFTTMNKNSYPSFLENNSDKAVLVNVFASWCTSCKLEMPLLNSIYSDFSGQNFKMIGISVDKNTDDLKKFIKKYRINFSVYIGTKELINSLGVTGVPETFFYKNGKFIKKAIGPVNENFRQFIKEQIN